MEEAPRLRTPTPFYKTGVAEISWYCLIKNCPSLIQSRSLIKLVKVDSCRDIDLVDSFSMLV